MRDSLDNFVRTDLITIDAEASLAAIEERLDRPVDYGLPVIAANGRLHGIIHPTDILRLSLQLGSRARGMPAGDLCHRARSCLPQGASLRRARRLMLTRDLDSLLVLDDAQRLVGIIFRRDLERQGLVPNRAARWRRPMRRPDTSTHLDRKLFASDAHGS